MQRALEEGETLQALVRCGRRGARDSQRAQNIAAWVGFWAALLVKRATRKSLSGASVPMQCWLAVTDRRLLVISTSRWHRDASLERSVVFGRVRGAKMRPPSEKLAHARIALMQNRDLELEAPLQHAAELAEAIRLVQAGAGESAAIVHRTYRTPMG
ncbi:MAG: hypothetical protein Q7V88_00785 [Actinomycetota bacterium]|nr:hypothetical protein [Actinomycetota bacterium]